MVVPGDVGRHGGRPASGGRDVGGGRLGHLLRHVDADDARPLGGEHPGRRPAMPPPAPVMIVTLSSRRTGSGSFLWACRRDAADAKAGSPGRAAPERDVR